MKYLLPFVTAGLLLTSCSSQNADQSILIYKLDGKESAYPRLSKDDNRILYQSNAGGNWQLVIMDIANGTHQHVMADQYNNNFPDWSPDNEWIAFASDRDGNEEIYLIRTDGRDLKRITKDPARDIHPYFSPDGKSLLFNTTRHGTFDVYRYFIETDSLSRITGYQDDETCARFSPDMKHIVMLKNGPTSDDVVLMDATTLELKNITGTPQINDGWPMFSYDNKWIYYSSMESGVYCIYRIMRDGTEKTKITSPNRNEEDARVCVSKDGKRIIYNKRIGNTIEIRRIDI